MSERQEKIQDNIDKILKLLNDSFELLSEDHETRGERHSTWIGQLGEAWQALHFLESKEEDDA